MLCQECSAQLDDTAVICPRCGALVVGFGADVPAPIDLPSFAVALDTYELMIRHAAAVLFDLVALYTRHAEGQPLGEDEEQQLAEWQSSTENAKERLRGIRQDIKTLDTPSELVQSSSEMVSAIADYVIAYVELQTAFGSGRTGCG